jgi:hypothetical protein
MHWQEFDVGAGRIDFKRHLAMRRLHDREELSLYGGVSAGRKPGFGNPLQSIG